MPESFVQVPTDGTGKRLRARERTVNAQTVHEQHVIVQGERVVSSRMAVSSFRTVGNAATTQTLFALENGAGSGVLVAVRRLSVYMDSTAALAAVVPALRCQRTTNMPTAGTSLTKVTWDSAQTTSAATVVARGATASDGGAATAITATLGGVVWEAMGQRLHTAVGQVLTDPIPVLPDLAANEPLIVRNGEAIAVAVNAAVATSNPATNHYIVNCLFEEFVLP
jgi:hypothetical protein